MLETKGADGVDEAADVARIIASLVRLDQRLITITALLASEATPLFADGAYAMLRPPVTARALFLLRCGIPMPGELEANVLALLGVLISTIGAGGDGMRLACLV